MSSSLMVSEEKTVENNQIKQVLRLLGGGYLVYLAYDLIKTSEGKGQFIAAAVVFGLAGGALFLHSLWKLVKSDYFRMPPPKDEENTEDK